MPFARTPFNRNMSTASTTATEASTLPVAPTRVVYKRSTGRAIVGTLVGFLLGLSAAGASSFWYLLDEYQRQALTLISSVDSVDRSVEKVIIPDKENQCVLTFL
jgi:TctA family transporter